MILAIEKANSWRIPGTILFIHDVPYGDLADITLYFVGNWSETPYLGILCPRNTVGVMYSPRISISDESANFLMNQR